MAHSSKLKNGVAEHSGDIVRYYSESKADTWKCTKCTTLHAAEPGAIWNVPRIYRKQGNKWMTNGAAHHTNCTGEKTNAFKIEQIKKGWFK